MRPRCTLGQLDPPHVPPVTHLSVAEHCTEYLRMQREDDFVRVDTLAAVAQDDDDV